MKIILQILLPVGIIAIAFFVVKHFVKLEKPLAKKEIRVAIPIVELRRFDKNSYSPPEQSYGTVSAYEQTVLSAQVSGKIIHLDPSFRVGNIIKKDTILAQIEKADFTAILAREQSKNAEAKQLLAKEQTLSKQAEEDWIASGRKLEKASDFVLRKPQLLAAKANLSASKESVLKASLDLERTSIKAPFDAIVSAKNVSVGRFLTPQVSIGELVATAKAEIYLAVTPSQMKRIGKTPFPIEISLHTPHESHLKWNAKITRTSPIKDQKNQVSYLIAEVNNPFTSNEKKLSIGTFVSAEIPASTIPDVFKIPEAALIHDSYIWAVEGDKLKKVPVTRQYANNGFVYVRIHEVQSLSIVTRPLTSFKEGMVVSSTADQKDQDYPDATNEINQSL